MPDRHDYERLRGFADRQTDGFRLNFLDFLTFGLTKTDLLMNLELWVNGGPFNLNVSQSPN